MFYLCLSFQFVGQAAMVLSVFRLSDFCLPLWYHRILHTLLSRTFHLDKHISFSGLSVYNDVYGTEASVNTGFIREQQAHLGLVSDFVGFLSDSSAARNYTPMK